MKTTWNDIEKSKGAYGSMFYAYKNMGLCDDPGNIIVCPFCQCINVHIEKTTVRSPSKKNGMAWSGKGNIMKCIMYCESGHKWDFGFAHHKG